MNFSHSAPGASAELHAGAVSLFRLLELYGSQHRVELDELWATAGTEYLVLFADPAGRDCAILPVGPAHEYRRLEPVLSLDIEGLHAVCYTPARGAPAVVPESRGILLSGPEWEACKIDFPAATAELVEAIRHSAPGEDPLRAMLGRLEFRAAELVRRDAELTHREHFVHESEERLGARADAHLVRLAELEQREVEILAVTREFHLRTGLTPAPFAGENLIPTERSVFSVSN